MSGYVANFFIFTEVLKAKRAEFAAADIAAQNAVDAYSLTNEGYLQRRAELRGLVNASERVLRERGLLRA